MSTRLQRLRREGLTESFPLSGPGFRRAAPWLLAGIAFVGLLTRLHPTVRYAVWGSDSGEYLLLTHQLVETGRIIFEYDGWGLAYPYFPGMFTLSGAVEAVTGVDGMLAVLWTTPALACTIGVLVALLAYRVTSDPRVGVVAGAIGATSAVIVITTSHAMPGTLGQVLLLAMLVFLPDAYKDKLHFVLFAVLGAALVLTHHLTTYFAVGILAMVPFYRELAQRHSDTRKLAVEAPLVLGLTVAAAFWWLVVAVPFRELIVGGTFPTDPYLTTLLFLLALAALPATVWLKRRRTAWHQAPRYPSFQRQRVHILSGLFGLLAALVFMIFVRVPGTDIKIAPITLAYAIPVLALLCFLPLGFAMARFYRHGTLLLGFLIAILASLAFASITNSRVLFPFRHVDYMVEAMAILAAIGMVTVYDEALASRVPAERGRLRAHLVVALGITLAAGAILSLPPREIIGGFEEGVTAEEMDAVRWADQNIPDGTTIAADHRISSLLWGLAGLHATWDYTPQAYHSSDPTVALAELADAKVPARDGTARIEYVFLSPPIEQGVTLLQWEQSSPMSPEAIAKFEDRRFFEPVYAKDDVRIYRVVWPEG